MLKAIASPPTCRRTPPSSAAHLASALGSGEAWEIRAEADKERQEILAEAYMEAEKIRGEGDAEAHVRAEREGHVLLGFPEDVELVGPIPARGVAVGCGVSVAIGVLDGVTVTRTTIFVGLASSVSAIAV